MKQPSSHRTTYGSHGSKLLADDLGFVHLTIAAARKSGLSLRSATAYARHNRAALREILAKSEPRHALESALEEASIHAGGNRDAYMRANNKIAVALDKLDGRAMRPEEKPGPAPVVVDFGWLEYATTVKSRRGESDDEFGGRVAEAQRKAARRSLPMWELRLGRIAQNPSADTLNEAVLAYQWIEKCLAVWPDAEREASAVESFERIKAALQ